MVYYNSSDSKPSIGLRTVLGRVKIKKKYETQVLTLYY